MKIYTRRGDEGQTDLFGGPRVGKDHPRVETYGAVDELNASIGLAAAATRQDDLRTMCQDIQSRLFDLGSQLATPDPKHREKSGLPSVEPAQVDALEKRVDELEGELEPLTRFILPGGTSAAAGFHVARTVCRRAERRVVSMDDVRPEVLVYLNRLSDFLFVLARWVAKATGEREVMWSNPQKRR